MDKSIISAAENNHRYLHSNGVSFLFMLFLMWTFVLLSRPQDIFTGLAPARPAFAVGIVVIFFFLCRVFASWLNPDPAAVPLPRSRQTNMYIALLCIMIIGVPFAYYRRGAFLFIFTDYMKVVLFYFIFIKMVDTVRKLEIALILACFGTGFYATVAFMQGVLKTQRLTFGTMFDPNDLAFFTLSFLPFNFLFISKECPLYQRVFSMVSIISSILVILMSGSRGGFLAFLIVMVLLLKEKRTVKRWFKVSLVATGIVFISFNINKINFSRYTISGIENDYNFTGEQGRISIWKKGMRFMFSNPLTGVGISCFPNAVGEYRAGSGLPARWQTAHNSLILVGAETGIAGFVLFGLMNIYAFRIFSRASRESISERLLKIGEMARIGFVGHFICIMFLSQTYSFYWIFYIALSCVLDRFMQWEAECAPQAEPCTWASIPALFAGELPKLRLTRDLPRSGNGDLTC